MSLEIQETFSYNAIHLPIRGLKLNEYKLVLVDLSACDSIHEKKIVPMPNGCVSTGD